MKSKRINWIDKLDWLKQYSHLTTREIAVKYREEFGPVTVKVLNLAMRRHNIPFKQYFITWEDKLDWIRESIIKYDDKEIILKEFNKEFNTSITFKNLEHVEQQYGIKLPIAKRLVMNSRKQLAEREPRPIGSEVTNHRGDVLLKIDENKYVLKHRYIYEQYHNVTLNDKEFIIFLDGDNTNFNIDNLYMIPQSIHLPMSVNGFYNLDRLSVIKTLEWKQLIKEKSHDN